MTPEQRLLHLATVLDSVPAGRFNLAYWSDSNPECGFAGCAVGWATQDPVLQAEGLTLNPPLGREPTYGRGIAQTWGWYAVMAFFGLSCEQAHRLFSSSAYFNPDKVFAPGTDDEDRADAVYDPAPAEVAARIRAFTQTWSTT